MMTTGAKPAGGQDDGADEHLLGQEKRWRGDEEGGSRHRAD